MSDFDDFIDGFYPYRKETTNYRRIPDEPRDRADVLAEITSMAQREDATGDEGKVSGSLYSGDHEHYAYLGQVFSQFSHANVLQRDMYPSATKFEGEIVAMVLDLLHGDANACGVVTSGGSESLITALYTYREAARERGVTKPNVVMPITAHVALDKGAYWMDIEVRHAPLTEAYTADVAAMAELIDDQTIALVGSAGDYAHGLIDPIEEIAALAQERGIGMHVDGCLGGMLWPWAEELGYDIPLWDFRVPGVTSISADTHKYGYALKGTSTLSYRSKDLRRHQYFTYPDWPGGLYLSPGLAGSRSGGLIAATWVRAASSRSAIWCAASRASRALPRALSRCSVSWRRRDSSAMRPVSSSAMRATEVSRVWRDSRMRSWASCAVWRSWAHSASMRSSRACAVSSLPCWLCIWPDSSATLRCAR